MDQLIVAFWFIVRQSLGVQSPSHNILEHTLNSFSNGPSKRARFNVHFPRSALGSVEYQLKTAAASQLTVQSVSQVQFHDSTARG